MHSGSPDGLTISSLRQEDSTCQQGVAHFNSRGNSNHSNKAKPPHVNREQATGGLQFTVTTVTTVIPLGITNHNPIETENLRSDENNNIRQPLRKSPKKLLMQCKCLPVSYGCRGRGSQIMPRQRQQVGYSLNGWLSNNRSGSC